MTNEYVITVTESQASPEVLDMLANLAQRIVELEREVSRCRRIADSEMSARAMQTDRWLTIKDEIDVLHSNQKRLSEEVEANDYAIDEINGKIGHLEADADDASVVIVELAKLLVEAHRKGSR